MRVLLALCAVVILFLAFNIDQPEFERKEKLSEYNFFEGNLAELKPAHGVIPYEVNTALFSNYAEKLRFIKLPEGTQAQYNDTSSLGFPVGTVLIKNFYYPVDFRNASKGKNILETRVLVHQSEGWQAYPYIWNSEQSEAYYDPAGETRTVSFINKNGKKITTPYVIPNKNQCKGCHTQNNKFVPIGTSARQLNREVNFEGKQNQLEYWKALGILRDIPAPSSIPRLAVWDDEKTGSLDSRARAYLDANCGHCHSRSGPANTSGLFLDIFEKNSTHLGVNKPPVAAGRGAGNLQFDIKAGEPQHSILLYRMNTTDPAIAMPEIGREQIHAEGVKLIEEWIRKNNFASQ
jgi:uncharacterized repeat protein (TIGR03806 family)